VRDETALKRLTTFSEDKLKKELNLDKKAYNVLDIKKFMGKLES